MSKLIMVGLLVGSLLVGAVPAMAQIQGGIGDPQTLAASGVLMPFFTSGFIGTVATLQLASPVSDNPRTHMLFFDNTCARIPISAGIPLTTNDIAFFQVGSAQFGPVATGTNGLITIANANATGQSLLPLEANHPLHARLYEFSTTDGRSRVIEPVILNTEEFPSPAHWWSPLRTGATFFAPLQTTLVQTDLVLICPIATIQGATGAAFGSDTGGGAGDVTFTNTGFPQINPRFPATAPTVDNIGVNVFDTNEVFLRDFTIRCRCIEPFSAIAASIHPIFADPVNAPFGTYTELFSLPVSAGINTNVPSPRTSFTGYTSSFTVGSAINAFFARLQNGSQVSINGTVSSSQR